MKIWVNFVVSVVFILWADIALSKEVKYSDIESLVVNSNKKAKSLDLQNESARLKTGYLGRSFIPDVSLFAGQESFESDPLGNQNTNFYGVNATANVFNGMSDYWEEEKRESQYKLQKIESLQTLNDIVYSAKESYLKISEMKSLIQALTEGIDQLNRVKAKVAKKVRGGTTARSDLTSISLVKVGFEENIRQINRSLVDETNKLSVLLGVANLNSDSIDESDMEKDLNSSFKHSGNKPLQVQRTEAQAQVSENEASSSGAKRLPSVDLFANYARVPFSSREYTSSTDRMEWQAGIKATWKIGDFFENSSQAASLRAESTYLQNIKEYNKAQFEKGVDTLKSNMASLLESIEGISKEIGLSKNYYSQVSSEYLRGVKSTSDLTTAFNQLVFLKQKRLNLIVQLHLAKAEIYRQTNGGK